jgi:hypothetical protein
MMEVMVRVLRSPGYDDVFVLVGLSMAEQIRIYAACGH